VNLGRGTHARKHTHTQRRRPHLHIVLEQALQGLVADAHPRVQDLEAQEARLALVVAAAGKSSGAAAARRVPHCAGWGQVCVDGSG
jgi:hypothetical protein